LSIVYEIHEGNILNWHWNHIENNITWLEFNEVLII